MEEHADAAASAKLAQYLTIAVQVAEAVIRMRAQRVAHRADALRAQAGADRAGRVAQRAADRLVWSPALAGDWASRADPAELGRVWGAAAGWAETDPAANLAATRAEIRLTELAPASMGRYSDLLEQGAERTAAMRQVLAEIATEAVQRQPPTAAATPPALDPSVTAVDGLWSRADADGARHPNGELTSTDPTIASLERYPPAAAVTGHAEQEVLVTASPSDLLGGAEMRTTEAGLPHPADVAALSHPVPFQSVPAAPKVATDALAAAKAAHAGKTVALTR